MHCDQQKKLLRAIPAMSVTSQHCYAPLSHSFALTFPEMSPHVKQVASVSHADLNLKPCPLDDFAVVPRQPYKLPFAHMRAA